MTAAKRYPRERFTRSLSTLCARLDAQHQVEFDYKQKSGSFAPISGKLRSTARVLWVYGSWAQGAADCGDLDLALDLPYEWVGWHGWLPGGVKALGLPDFDDARKGLLTAPPLVHILDAARIRRYGPVGGFAVHPDTMMPIWLAPDLTDQEKVAFGLTGDDPAKSWADRIAAITVDPDYKRAPRVQDALPLKVGQTGMRLPEVEAAIRAQEQGLIAWTFLPHGERRGDEAQLTAAERTVAARHPSNDLAQITRTIAAVRHLRKDHPTPTFRYGNGCGIWARMFDDFDKKRSACIVITPRWSSQGPNGSLVITKGPNHSLAALEAFDASEKELQRVEREAEYKAYQALKSSSLPGCASLACAPGAA